MIRGGTYISGDLKFMFLGDKKLKGGSRTPKDSIKVVLKKIDIEA